MIDQSSRRLLYVDNVEGVFDINEEVIGSETKSKGKISVIENGPKTMINLLDWYMEDNLENNGGIELRDSLSWAPVVMGLDAPTQHRWELRNAISIVNAESDEITITIKLAKGM